MDYKSSLFLGLCLAFGCFVCDTAGQNSTDSGNSTRQNTAAYPYYPYPYPYPPPPHPPPPPACDICQALDTGFETNNSTLETLKTDLETILSEGLCSDPPGTSALIRVVQSRFTGTPAMQTRSVACPSGFVLFNCRCVSPTDGGCDTGIITFLNLRRCQVNNGSDGGRVAAVATCNRNSVG